MQTQININDGVLYTNKVLSTVGDEPRCCCYEFEGDNKDCPIHGGTFKDEHDDPDRDNADILKAALAAGFTNATMKKKEM